MFDTKRKEAMQKKLEKMKKAELIEYIMDMLDTHADTSKQLHELIGELSFSEQRIEQLEEELKQVKKNDRGAGRKEKFTGEQIEQILQSRREGKSMRTIAKEFHCSAGLVHKLIKNKEKEM